MDKHLEVKHNTKIDTKISTNKLFITRLPVVNLSFCSLLPQNDITICVEKVYFSPSKLINLFLVGCHFVALTSSNHLFFTLNFFVVVPCVLREGVKCKRDE